MALKKIKKAKQKSAVTLGAFLLAPITLPDIQLNPLTLPLGKFEYCDGNTWYPLASESWVNATAPGTITSITAGTGLSGGTITSSGTIALANTGVMPGSYTLPNMSVDATGRILSVTNGTVPISSLNGYPASSSTFLRGDGTWILPYINNLNINGTVSFASYGLTTSGNVSATTGTLIGNNLAAYNSGAIIVQSPLSFNNISGNPIVATNSSNYWIVLNNTNASATATGFTVQNNGTQAVEFGFNNSTNQAYIWAYGSATLKFGTNGTQRMQLLNNGTLVMYDDGTYSLSGSYGYLNASGSTGTATSSGYYSISCPNRIKASEFNAYSSEKKKNLLGFGEEIEGEVLQKFRHIPFFKYTYKDPVREGKATCYGVTAESLQEVLPDYVDEGGEDWIPNILQEASVTKVNGYYHLALRQVPVLYSQKLKIILKDKEVEAEIIHQQDNLLEIKCSHKLPSQVFVYGTYESCSSVSKQKLFEMGLIVLQNLLKRVEYLEGEVQTKH